MMKNKNTKTHTAELSCESFADKIPEIFSLLSMWFLENKREMPWRDDPTPYHVFVSEIMLQQTRVDTVIPYYLRFIERIPDVKTLSVISDDELLKYWEGLGYYSRVRNMKKAAVKIEEEYQGIFPDGYESLLTLPGIGSYTAGAITSIAYHKPYPVVDGNVLRVISRIFGLSLDISKESTKALYWNELFNALQKEEIDPGIINQSLMELGAIRCLPNGEPKCDTCPVSQKCMAKIEGKISEIPVKAEKKQRKIENLSMLIFICDDEIGIIKRTNQGLLSGLYGFPYIEKHLDQKNLKETLLKDFHLENVIIEKQSDKKHVFTHVEWKMKRFFIQTNSEDKEKISQSIPGLFFVKMKELQEAYALPTAFKILLEGYEIEK